MKIDILIKGGKTVDKSIIDIAILDDKIIEVKNQIDDSKYQANQIINLDGKTFISAGWIDIHTHCYERLEIYKDYPDEVGIKSGVTTVVDTGTTGALDIEKFYEDTKKYKTNVYALINIAKQGITSQDELSNMMNIDEDELKNAVKKYKDFVVGIKARMSKSVVISNGIEPLKLAKRIKKELNLPMMVHFGSSPPTIEDILGYMEKGDILTHIYNGKPNGILKGNKIKEEIIEARERGIILDVGHGTESFSMDVAMKAKDVGLFPDTISTDIYIKNRINGPVYSLSTTMEKFIYMGYSLEDIINKVTKNAANAINLKNKGLIKEGYDADLTIFDVVNEEKELQDSLNKSVITNTSIKPRAVVINGEYLNIGESTKENE
ncbi:MULTISPECIES: amidohydrolase/deacetylase family metallohydrolase [unclassified Clostridioides]|uniref:amidohydrolase/deacetylase family metallohydrolase n=1 Tax=unclassified Clostridioides TaxID=2635829 RepID=UPI001D1137F4|nr:amidohydrolase/deacetylase family metallohydrolase [Clostridioides sp. ZZV14-6150]MCC0662180.1 amidohydrolase/deacetylase family metallohydrolase [Clostridioides sp. ZZV14-6154]MCC0669968.1 amidohydrolase/deacetylase family metallohydrolase [Clostridioides sp. ZZV14-6153]MCC0719884.1 amidohydrolase/deacetylase family metallohydrolase [Clostridioides sp. ZZV14-6105]MCC0724126.1 amidohydrolase/deacetylase family metallohydrolase [Clostridioides sp. ZZV14-6104]MCC0726144.1 amidohydrolase/deace